MKARILGCGTSSGVPRIGNDWGACDPTNTRNRRTRVSILVETASTRILVDTGPDLREQLLAADVAQLDAVIWTHDHADHCHGIDDLRQVFHASGQPVRGLARADTLATLTNRFAYVFQGRAGYPSTVSGELLPDRFDVGDISVEVVDQPHGSITSAGLCFRHDDRLLVYATDFHSLTDQMQHAYRNADLLVIDALRRAPHPTHPTIDQAVAWSQVLGARRTILTHMDHSVDYERTSAELPIGVEPGYDGLEITV